MSLARVDRRRDYGRPRQPSPLRTIQHLEAVGVDVPGSASHRYDHANRKARVPSRRSQPESLIDQDVDWGGAKGISLAENCWGGLNHERFFGGLFGQSRLSPWRC
jgi:hypothetical protein